MQTSHFWEVLIKKLGLATIRTLLQFTKCSYDVQNRNSVFILQTIHLNFSQQFQGFTLFSDFSFSL